MSDSPVVQFDCRFHYPAAFALDFEFTAGEGVTALVGPSGVGKTTVLNLIAGLLRPDAGRIALRGGALFDARSNFDLPPERRAVGYVFQDYQLFPHLTVGDNLRYGQRRQVNGRVEFDSVLAALELNDLVNRPPATLSGGQKQRVAIGRAILRNPKLLLLDEPLNAVHWQLRDCTLDYLRRIADTYHLPTLLVSHDRQSIAQFADAIVELGAAT